MHLSTLNAISGLTASEDCIGGMEWFAIQVKCRYEERIATSFVEKGFEVISGVATARTATRKTRISEPKTIFPGYVFSRFDIRYRMPILVTPGVHRIVGYGKTPVAVDAQEIEAIRQVLESGQPVESCPYLAVGSQVQVIDGPLRGMQGILVQQRSSFRVVLSVSLIQRSIRVEVPQQAVMPLQGSARTSLSSASGV